MTKYRLTVMLLQALLQFIPVLLSAIRHKPLWFLLYIAITSALYRPGLFKHRGLLYCVSVRHPVDFANIVAYYVDIALTTTCTLVCTGGHALLSTGYHRTVYQHTVFQNTSGQGPSLPGITGRLAQFTSQATVILARFTIRNNSHSRVTLTSLSHRIALQSVSIFMQSSPITSLPGTCTSF